MKGLHQPEEQTIDQRRFLLPSLFFEMRFSTFQVTDHIMAAEHLREIERHPSFRISSVDVGPVFDEQTHDRRMPAESSNHQNAVSRMIHRIGIRSKSHKVAGEFKMPMMGRNHEKRIAFAVLFIQEFPGKVKGLQTFCVAAPGERETGCLISQTVLQIWPRSHHLPSERGLAVIKLRSIHFKDFCVGL